MRILSSLLAQAEGSKLPILIAGLGNSGLHAASALLRRGLEVVGIESKSRSDFLSETPDPVLFEKLESAGFRSHFAGGLELFNEPPVFGFGVLSPGISPASGLSSQLKRLDIPLVSELELGIELASQRFSPRLIVVSGSNGKSTTAALLNHILIVGGKRSVLCGNIGRAVTSLECDGVESDYLVVEASSYQLANCLEIHADISVLMNVTENHIEWHGSFESYASAKARVWNNQTADDFAVLNADDPVVARLARSIQPVCAWFGHSPIADYQIVGNGESRRIDMPGGSVFQSESSLIGDHNAYNIAAAFQAAAICGIPLDVMKEGLKTFRPLEHRLEPVNWPGPGLIINDSKSTSVSASTAAIRAVRDCYPSRPLLLMLGGKAKQMDWQPLAECLVENEEFVKHLLFFGADGPELLQAFQRLGFPCSVFPTLQAATNAGLKALEDASVLLLTPGCTSFDEFSDFEDRGRAFKSYVSAMAATR